MNWYTTLSVVAAALAAASVLTPLPEGVADVAGGKQHASLALKVAYLGGFAVALGTSVWVTFVAGVVLFRTLPRHQFGQVQSQLFPAYFRLVAASASIAIASLAALRPLLSRSALAPSSPYDSWQVAALGLPVVGALANLLILEPMTSRVMRERHAIEKAAGIGGEVGLSKNREVAKTNPELRAVNKRFGMCHGMSSLANLLGLMGLAAHLYYLALRLQL